MNAKAKRLTVAVVTNCTATSSMDTAPTLEGKNMPRGLSLEEALKHWEEAIQKTREEHPDFEATPSELYRGQGFYEITQLMDDLGDEYDASLYIVSLGFGLVKSNEKILSYNINTWSGDDEASLVNIVTAEPFTPARWWSGINRTIQGKGSPISDLSGQFDHVLIATTGRFLDMITDDILNTPQASLGGLRVFSSAKSGYQPVGHRMLKASNILLNYDIRLNKIMPGNRNSFVQRSARHFVQNIMGNAESSLSKQQAEVDKALKVIASERPKRSRAAGLDKGALEIVVKECKKNGVEFEEALATCESRLGTSIHPEVFRLVWDSAVELDAARKTAAVSALSFSHRNGGDEYLTSEAVVSLRTFVKVVKEISPGASFTSKEICEWAVKYHKSVKEKVPEIYQSAKRLSLAIRKVGSMLDIVPQARSSTYGVTRYVVR